VDRFTGHITPLKLPDYDPAVSQVIWFCDCAAYCRVTTSGKSLYVAVAPLAVCKPVVATKLGKFDPDTKGKREPNGGAAEWQREPLRVLFTPPGATQPSISFPDRRCGWRTRRASRQRRPPWRNLKASAFYAAWLRSRRKRSTSGWAL
jgi:hypothetical protein